MVSPGLHGSSPEFRAPAFALSDITVRDFALGLVFLALPQLPLTLGNAIISTADENNRLSPDRRVNENTLSTSTGEHGVRMPR